MINLMNINGIFEPCGLKIYFVGYDKIRFKSHTSLLIPTGEEIWCWNIFEQEKWEEMTVYFMLIQLVSMVYRTEEFYIPVTAVECCGKLLNVACS